MAKRIAIIGGGILGSLTALELAHLGHQVELIERNVDLLGEASLHNEGKIHLGFIYAKDVSLRTAEWMVEGALSFREILWRLCGFRTETALSTPFWYAIHRDSLTSPGEFHHHLDCCVSLFSDRQQAFGGTYIDGSRRPIIGQLPPKAWDSDLDPDQVTAVFETSELSVDPRAVAKAVRNAVRADKRITLRTGVTVKKAKVEVDSISLTVAGQENIDISETFTTVINASWADLIRLDRQAGLPTPSTWSYRYKLASRINTPLSEGDLHSVTVVLGPFGDIVNFGGAGLFMSWYPTGRLMFSSNENVEDWNSETLKSTREKAFLASAESWALLSRRFSNLDSSLPNAEPLGGIILADGLSDVDDADSSLHLRVGSGIRRLGHYFSVNTGKYTTAPSLAIRVANEVNRAMMET